MKSKRVFIKKMCFSGVCLCGFGSLFSNNVSDTLGLLENTKEENETMPLKWIKEVLSNLDDNLEEEQLRKIIKSTSIAHHEKLNLENMFCSYRGRLNEFVEFLKDEWDWKISYEENGKVLIADENKPVCVCPLLKNEKEKKYPALCYCSEGFAERMFSFVCEKSVEAVVISSIQKGDERCIYRITLG